MASSSAAVISREDVAVAVTSRSCFARHTSETTRADRDNPRRNHRQCELHLKYHGFPGGARYLRPTRRSTLYSPEFRHSARPITRAGSIFACWRSLRRKAGIELASASTSTSRIRPMILNHKAVTQEDGRHLSPLLHLPIPFSEKRSEWQQRWMSPFFAPSHFSAVHAVASRCNPSPQASNRFPARAAVCAAHTYHPTTQRRSTAVRRKRMARRPLPRRLPVQPASAVARHSGSRIGGP